MGRVGDVTMMLRQPQFYIACLLFLSLAIFQILRGGIIRHYLSTDQTKQKLNICAFVVFVVGIPESGNQSTKSSIDFQC